jgi:hypothetical protein
MTLCYFAATTAATKQIGSRFRPRARRSTLLRPLGEADVMFIHRFIRRRDMHRRRYRIVNDNVSYWCQDTIHEAYRTSEDIVQRFRLPPPTSLGSVGGIFNGKTKAVQDTIHEAYRTSQDIVQRFRRPPPTSLGSVGGIVNGKTKAVGGNEHKEPTHARLLKAGSSHIAKPGRTNVHNGCITLKAIVMGASHLKPSARQRRFRAPSGLKRLFHSIRRMLGVG